MLERARQHPLSRNRRPRRLQGPSRSKGSARGDQVGRVGKGRTFRFRHQTLTSINSELSTPVQIVRHATADLDSGGRLLDASCYHVDGYAWRSDIRLRDTGQYIVSIAAAWVAGKDTLNCIRRTFNFDRLVQSAMVDAKSWRAPVTGKGTFGRKEEPARRGGPRFERLSAFQILGLLVGRVVAS